MTIGRAEPYRISFPGYESKLGDPFGCFQWDKLRIICAPTDEEWQHVSVSTRNRTPTWEEMCRVKDLFWDENETIIQFHPPKKEYVNNHAFCLHLWSHKEYQKTPPSILWGLSES